MKKIATLLVLFSLGLFTVAPMVGCGDKGDKGGEKDKAGATDKGGDKAADKGDAGDKEAEK